MISEEAAAIGVIVLVISYIYIMGMGVFYRRRVQRARLAYRCGTACNSRYGCDSFARCKAVQQAKDYMWFWPIFLLFLPHRIIWRLTSGSK